MSDDDDGTVIQQPGLRTEIEIPLVKKRCKVWQLIAGAFVLGLIVGAVFF